MKKFSGKFSRFDIIHQRDRQTDEHRTTAKTALCIALRDNLRDRPNGRKQKVMFYFCVLFARFHNKYWAVLSSYVLLHYLCMYLFILVIHSWVNGEMKALNGVRQWVDWCIGRSGRNYHDKTAAAAARKCDFCVVMRDCMQMNANHVVSTNN